MIASFKTNHADVLYGHGLVWNRDLPGDAGKVNLSFELRVNLATGTGFGTASDPVYPDWNVHFAIDAVERTKAPKGETLLDLSGHVTDATEDAKVGLPVRILAQPRVTRPPSRSSLGTTPSRGRAWSSSRSSRS